MVAGPSLVFIAMTEILARMPGGRILGFLFFATLFIAVITGMFAFIEIPAAVVRDRFKMERSKAVILTTAFIFICSVACAWSQGNGPLSGIQIPWIGAKGVVYYSIIDWVDCFSSYILMPIGNIAVALFCVKIWGFDKYEKELTVNGRDGKLGIFSKIVIGIGIPVFSLIVLLNVFGFLN